MVDTPVTQDMLEGFTTESRNESSMDIDSRSTTEILRIINAEDKRVPFAVEQAIDRIGALVDDVVAAFKKGGRLFYIGAGTSGRLGVLDASECPPTFGVSPTMVQGLIAGGNDALVRSIEGAEDDSEAGVLELKRVGFTAIDILVGITASGQAPYVLGAMAWVRELGAVVAAISCNRNSKTFDFAKHSIFLDVGPEVVTGSTRMKAGTAQKLTLNMVTTTAMIRIGKVYRNLMVDLTRQSQTHRALQATHPAGDLLQPRRGCQGLRGIWTETQSGNHHGPSRRQPRGGRTPRPIGRRPHLRGTQGSRRGKAYGRWMNKNPSKAR